MIPLNGYSSGAVIVVRVVARKLSILVHRKKN